MVHAWPPCLPLLSECGDQWRLPARQRVTCAQGRAQRQAGMSMWGGRRIHVQAQQRVTRPTCAGGSGSSSDVLTYTVQLKVQLQLCLKERDMYRASVHVQAGTRGC